VGTIVLNDTAGPDGGAHLVQASPNGGTLTIAPGITVTNTKSGTVGNADWPLVNQGHIHAAAANNFV